MIDPFHNQIVERLGKTLDYNLFEDAVADLLRTAWPKLVPVRGGADAGMDGAVADGHGPPFPLVTTTAKHAIDNLTRNLRSYRNKGGMRREVIFATSRTLTPRVRGNLENRANKLGFTLVQIYDQSAIANLLYRNPRWCKELLNLSGDPSPLSIIPKTARPLLNQQMIGRGNALEWIQNTPGDKLLVGQPGTGKTFLLQQLASSGGALFVISQDRGELAAAIREQQPSTLIVDDAKSDQQLLLNLKQLRESTRSEFSIFASCWPWDKESVAQTLTIANPNIHELELLTRDQIVDVIKGSSILGPDHLIQELVSQAEGRPGLAVTLSHLCLIGNVSSVISGDSLAKSTLEVLRPIVGTGSGSILAAFALGDDAGMSMHTVAQSLGFRLSELREKLEMMAQGGLLWQVNEQFLSVRPPALRNALIRDVFFSGALSLPIMPLLAQVPSVRHAARALMGARSLGAPVRDELILPLLENAGLIEDWRDYASLGQHEARWVLEHMPDRVVGVASPALHFMPGIAIPMLLQKAVGDDRPLNSTTDHPLRLVKDWVHSGRPRTGAGLERRKLLFKSTHVWFAESNDVSTALYGFTIALSPEFHAVTSNPGSGMSVTIHRGGLPVDQLEVLIALWKDFWTIVDTMEVEDWGPVIDTIRLWAYPSLVWDVTPTPEHAFMRQQASELLAELTSRCSAHPGFLHQVGRIVKGLDLDVDVTL